MAQFPLNLRDHLDALLPILDAHATVSPSDFALRIKSTDLPVSVADAAHLLDCYQRASQKFPGIHRQGLLYTRKALEQSTGEALIRYKTELFEGAIAVDLTGGLGMDTLSLSQNFKNVIYVEKDPIVMEIAKHNHTILGCRNITHVCEDAEVWLNSCTGTKFDLIYADPSRRNDTGRQFLLKDCEPDIRELLPLLDKLTKRLLVKVSPLYDIKQLTRELPNIQNIEVISVQNEVKEILISCLFHGTPDEEGMGIKAVRLDKQGNHLSVHGGGIDDREYPLPTASEIGNYLYEPDAAIIKAGMTAAVASIFYLEKINPNTIYLTSEELCPVFPGKTYEIMDVLPYKSKMIAAYLWENNLEAVHIHKRDFPLKPEELFKKFHLRMGDQAHLFFTKSPDGTHIMISAQLLDF